MCVSYFIYFLYALYIVRIFFIFIVILLLFDLNIFFSLLCISAPPKLAENASRIKSASTRLILYESFNK